MRCYGDKEGASREEYGPENGGKRKQKCNKMTKRGVDIRTDEKGREYLDEYVTWLQRLF